MTSNNPGDSHGGHRHFVEVAATWGRGHRLAAIPCMISVTALIALAGTDRTERAPARAQRLRALRAQASSPWRQSPQGVRGAAIGRDARSRAATKSRCASALTVATGMPRRRSTSAADSGRRESRVLPGAAGTSTGSNEPLVHEQDAPTACPDEEVRVPVPSRTLRAPRELRPLGGPGRAAGNLLSEEGEERHAVL
jgi:hypothetical protein